MKNYKELIIWQTGIDLVKKIYQLTKYFPPEEKYGMVSQITRAAISVSANIAEGSSRNSDKDYARFLQLSLGSAFEVQTYLVIARELNWSDENMIIESELILEKEIKMLHSFIKTLSANGQ